MSKTRTKNDNITSWTLPDNIIGKSWTSIFGRNMYKEGEGFSYTGAVEFF